MMNSSAKSDFILLFDSAPSQNEFVSEILKKTENCDKAHRIQICSLVDCRHWTLNMRIAYDKATAENAMPNRMRFFSCLSEKLNEFGENNIISRFSSICVVCIVFWYPNSAGYRLNGIILIHLHGSNYKYLLKANE